MRRVLRSLVFALSICLAPIAFAEEPPADQSNLPVPMPDREKELVGFFSDAREELKAARSAAERASVRVKLQVRIADFMRTSQDLIGWTGTVADRGQTPEGDYWITIALGDTGVTIFTPRNRLDDHDHLMLIKPDTTLGKAVTALKITQPVAFTAHVFGLEVRGDESTIARPQFYAQFKALKPN